MNSVHLLDVEWLLQRQLSQVGDWHNVQYIPESGDPLYQLVSEQHHTNFDLWHEEDKARDPDASDAIIATVKRSIDRLNQKRNDEIEKIDEAIVSKQKERPRENSRISIAGRPNINEISKRNEAIANQERKSFYKVAGIIVLLIIAIIFLLYFFS